jgi:hypothetical protein
MKSHKEETIHRDSEGISLHNNIPFLNTPFASSLNYVDKDNKHPVPGETIQIKNIVFSKEELVDNKWLILSPVISTLEFKTDVLRILNHWLKINVQIIIQSEEHIRYEEKKQKLADTENDVKKKLREEKKKQKAGNFKFEDINQDPLKLPPEFIKAKYHSLDDFKKNIPFYEYYESDFQHKIAEQYKAGDEIWHYKDFDNHMLGWQIESFLLIRNNKIKCSPIIRSQRVCFAV